MELVGEHEDAGDHAVHVAHAEVAHVPDPRPVTRGVTPDPQLVATDCSSLWPVVTSCRKAIGCKTWYTLLYVSLVLLVMRQI